MLLVCRNIDSDVPVFETSEFTGTIFGWKLLVMEWECVRVASLPQLTLISAHQGRHYIAVQSQGQRGEKWSFSGSLWEWETQTPVQGSNDKHGTMCSRHVTRQQDDRHSNWLYSGISFQSGPQPSPSLGQLTASMLLCQLHNLLLVETRPAPCPTVVEAPFGDDRAYGTPKTLLKPSFEEVSQAYSTCAKYLQKKVPLQSKTLQCLSAMDPVVRGHSQTGFELKKLTQMIRLSP
ncbi:hypothetical protein F2P81_006010 [Scophthalmus maximus]|uniref:Uncharacterized protein n=1 Tax=Scophthalmus maximus TaxID=52904 RepID=A0A6A4TDK2_SCOMX|nr:hypothetical protein F2P81_006010 [Scophthalmus maximus]